MSNRIPYEAPFGASIEVVRLQPDAALPFRAYKRSAALDVSAYLPKKTMTISPNSTVCIPTGLAARPPEGHCLLVCSRSGLAQRSIFVANAPGVIDPDYTGEIKVLLFNGGISPAYVRHGDRIAQLLCIPLMTGFFAREVAGLPQTERGDRGFGSSGR